MENLLQEIADDLDELSSALVRWDYIKGTGLIKNIGTNIKMLADELGLDVDMRTPIDLGRQVSRGCPLTKRAYLE